MTVSIIGFYKNLHFRKFSSKQNCSQATSKTIKISGMTKEQKILYIAFHNKKGGDSKLGATLEFKKFWGYQNDWGYLIFWGYLNPEGPYVIQKTFFRLKNSKFSFKSKKINNLKSKHINKHKLRLKIRFMLIYMLRLRVVNFL